MNKAEQLARSWFEASEDDRRVFMVLIGAEPIINLATDEQCGWDVDITKDLPHEEGVRQSDS